MQDIMSGLNSPSQDEGQSKTHEAAIALAEAMNRARGELMDRENATSEARAISIARLESLRKKLAPLYAAIPRDVELFDLGLVSHEKPRLFVDILAFVEMSRDQTAYRFLQERRTGRIVLAETRDDDELIGQVTRYIARRLVDRERALSADARTSTDWSAGTGQPPSLTSITSDKSTIDHLTIERAVAALETHRRDDADANPAAVADRPTMPKAAPAMGMAQSITPHGEGYAPQANPLLDAATAPGADSRNHDSSSPDAAPKATSHLAPKISEARQSPAPAGVAAAVPASGRATTRSSSASWFWPFLAMLIGISAGAAGLVYSATYMAK